MGKRFTDTDKWKKAFIKSLPLEYKCFWFYLLDDCDFAGVWDVDIEVAELRLGTKLSIEKARGFFDGKIVEFDNGTKWFVPDFINFQYGVLTPANKIYNKIVSALKKNNLMGHLSPINGGIDMDKEEDKEEVKEEDEGGAGETKSNLITYPFGDDFFKNWIEWKKYAKKKHDFVYDIPQTEQSALHQLVTLSDGTEKNCLDIINQSMAYGWKTFFPLKNKSHGQTNSKGSELNADYKRKLAERMAANSGKGG